MPIPFAMLPVALDRSPPLTAQETGRAVGLRALAAFALIFAVGALVHRDLLTWPAPHVDEVTYLSAFELAAAGANPYDEPGFMYTPPFALVGAAAWKALGPAFLPALRLANLAGACVLALAALTGSPWPRAWRLAAAGVAVCSPLVADGLQCGSISLLLLGIVVGALAVAPAHPWLAGAAVGLVTASKPVAVSALVVLATPDRGAGWPRHRLRTVLGAGVAGALWLLLGVELLPSMLARAGGLPTVLTNVSLPRVLYAFGLPVHPAITFALVTALGAAWAWWRRPSARARLAIAASTSLLALPIANPSTLVYSLPAQVLALERAIAGFRVARRRGGRRRALAELALAIAAVLSVNGALGVAAAGELPLAAQGFVTLMPLAAVAGLTVYGSGEGAPEAP